MCIRDRIQVSLFHMKLVINYIFRSGFGVKRAITTVIGGYVSPESVSYTHLDVYKRQEEDRNPSMTEIRVLDTYWSDHCRHTTFSTELKDVTFGDGYYKPLFEKT